MKLFKRKRVVTLKTYALIKNDEKEFIDYVLKNSLKPNSTLRIGRKKLKPKQLNFWKLSWNDIILVRHHVSNKNMQAVHKLIYGITDKQFIKLDVFNCAACYKWVVNQVRMINEIESNELDSEMSSEDKAAGAERLGQYGFNVSLRGFRGDDITKDKELLQTPYEKIFKEICIRDTISDINQQKAENARRKNTRNRR